MSPSTLIKPLVYIITLLDHCLKATKQNKLLYMQWRAHGITSGCITFIGGEEVVLSVLGGVDKDIHPTPSFCLLMVVYIINLYITSIFGQNNQVFTGKPGFNAGESTKNG